MARRERDPVKEQYWRQVLGQWQRSGATIRGFCARRRLSEASFHAWRREVARRDREQQAAATGADFVPVRVVGAQSLAVEPAAIEIVLPGNVTVRVSAGAEGACLRAVLAALGATAATSADDRPRSSMVGVAGGKSRGLPSEAAGEARSC